MPRHRHEFDSPHRLDSISRNDGFSRRIMSVAPLEPDYNIGANSPDRKLFENSSGMPAAANDKLLLDFDRQPSLSGFLKGTEYDIFDQADNPANHKPF